MNRRDTLSNRPIIRRLLYYLRAARARALRWLVRLRSSSAKSKLVLLEPTLIESDGHQAEAARFFEAELGPEFDVRVYANFSVRSRLAIQLGAQPVFYDDFYVMDEAADFDSLYRSKSESMLKALRNINLRDLNPSTIIVIYTATMPQLGGLAQWFAELASAHRPKIFLHFQFPLEFAIKDKTKWPSAIGLAREAVGRMAAIGTVRITSNCESLAKHIYKRLDQPCAVTPFPIRWPSPRQVAPVPLGPVFGFFGGLRREKGAAIMAAAIPRFVAAHPDARFLVHVAAPGSDLEAVEVLNRLPQVELIRTVFTDKDEYFARFLEAGCILLPYEPAAYANRTSGILIEALGLGRMIITTGGTWMEAELNERGKRAFVMPRFHPDDLVLCLEQARLGMLGRQGAASFDHRIISECSTASFCKTMVELMRS